MKIDKQEQLVPMLRFPTFKTQLKEQTISSIANLTSSKRIHRADYSKRGIPFYRGKEISELKQGLPIEDLLYIKEDHYDRIRDSYGVPLKNDILITAVGTLGNVYRIPDDSRFYFKDGNLIWFQDLSSHPNYVEHLLDASKKEILKTAIGSSQKALTIEGLNRLKLKLHPDLAEQQKIASFLTAVDKRIEQLTKKKKLLEEYKKGVMQKIFNQEIRFKDENGEEFPEWEEQHLGEMFSFVRNASFSRKDLTDTGKYRYIHYGDIHTKYSSQLKGDNTDIPYIAEHIDYDKYTDDVLCSGDLLIADASEDYADIGKLTELVDSSSQKILGGLHTIVARPQSGIFHLGFLSYLMQTFGIRKQIMKEANGISVLGISKTSLKKIILQVPSKQEQQSITEFLNDLTVRQNSNSKSIELLRAFKKGLLQQMFI